MSSWRFEYVCKIETHFERGEFDMKAKLKLYAELLSEFQEP